MDVYEVEINGIPHTVQLDKAPKDASGKTVKPVGTQTKAEADAEAKAREEAAAKAEAEAAAKAEAEAKAAETANKSRTPANKGTEQK